MSATNENITNKNVLSRDGTAQKDRLMPDLTPENHPLDGRSMEDLERFVSSFAKMINFYQPGTALNEVLATGDWSKFYPENWSEYKERPHLALMSAFLLLFVKVQEHANTIPKRHLDYFYREYLLFVEQQAVPDKAHLLFELSKNIKTYKLDEGTQFTAGKDNSGVELIYKLQKELVLNKAVADEFKSVFNGHISNVAEGKVRNASAGFTSPFENPNGLYASPISNSGDGQGADLNEAAPEWRPFGEEQNNLEDDSRTMPDASIGFALATQQLHLAEGDRYIILKIDFGTEYDAITAPSSKNATGGAPNGSLALLNDDDLGEVFDFSLSTKKKWITPQVMTQDEVSQGQEYTRIQGETMIFVLKVDATEPAIIPFNKEKLEGGFDTSFPMLRGIIKDTYTYLLFSQLRIERIELTVEVKGIRNLIVQNDLARLTPDKPFLPFGPKPKKNGNFYIGCEEAFQKNLDTLDLEMEWGELPEDFTAHYQDFNQAVDAGVSTPVSLDETKFKVKIERLQDRVWEDSTTWDATASGNGYNLFASGVSGDEYNKQKISLNINDGNPFNIEGITQSAPTFGVESLYGFIRLKLQAFDFIVPDDSSTTYTYPNFVFGHKEYTTEFAKRSLAAALNETGSTDPTVLPPEPYTPLLNSIALNYKATIEITPETKNEEFFHIEPFGYSLPQFAGKDETGSSTYLKPIPTFQDEGTFYVGITDLKPPQNISLLFQIAEGSADPQDIPEFTAANTDASSSTGPIADTVENSARPDDVVWTYLGEDNVWRDFQPTEILADTTNNLRTSGIISYSIPKDAVSENTILTNGKHWLRATVKWGTSNVCNLIDVKSQAALVEFDDQGNDPGHLSDPLVKDSISKLKNGVSQVKTVSQPFASFGGKVTERDDEFYVRVSERLRHKGRSETLWDYERLVLESFPSIYKIKCVNHTNDRGQHTPGHVLLVGIPNIRNANAVNVLEPRNSLNTLDEIKQHLEVLAPPYTTIHVENPKYEKIRLRFSVKFYEGFDVGFYTDQLHTDITRYLSPWAFEDGAEIAFNGSIHKYAIMNFIENLEYVDYVFNFVLLYQENEATPEDANEGFVERTKVQASDPRAILVSDTNHIIDVVTTDPDPVDLGYCEMAIERNFTILPKP